MIKSETKERNELNKSLEDESLFGDGIPIENLNDIKKNDFRDFSYEEDKIINSENSEEFIEYLKSYGIKSYRLTVDEEEELLNNSLWKYYSGMSILGVFKVSETKTISLIETNEVHKTIQISDKDEPITYSSENQIQVALTIKKIDGDLSVQDKLLFDKLKTNPEIEFIKKSDNYYFKYNRTISKLDLNLFFK